MASYGVERADWPGPRAGPTDRRPGGGEVCVQSNGVRKSISRQTVKYKSFFRGRRNRFALSHGSAKMVPNRHVRS